MKNLKKYPLVIFFGVLLYAISILDWFSPVEKFSDLENRSLATFPHFTLKALINNKYTPQIEDFTEDHFFFRNGWISLKSMSEQALGKIENNNIIYGKDGYMFTKVSKTDSKIIEDNFSAFNKFTQRHSDRNIKFMLVPTAPGVLKDKVYPHSPVVDNDGILQALKKSISSQHYFDVNEVLNSHSSDYIYYRTDHHWTSLGAYYAYEAYAKDIGKKPSNLNELKFAEMENFLGTHYSKAKSYNVVSDVFSYLDIDAEIDIQNVKNSIYDKEKLNTRDKYAMFLRGNNGLSTVKGDGSGKIMIIKDSYANSFVPFLIHDFEQIDIVDMRYLNMGLDALIEKNDYQQILFLYNAETFSTDKDFLKINLFNSK